MASHGMDHQLPSQSPDHRHALADAGDLLMPGYHFPLISSASLSSLTSQLRKEIHRNNCQHAVAVYDKYRACTNVTPHYRSSICTPYTILSGKLPWCAQNI